MVKPIYMQDNLSKTLLAQEVVDRMIAGVEKAREADLKLSVQQLEDEAKNITESLEERKSTHGIRSEEKQEHQKRERKHKKKKSQVKLDKEREFSSTDLRLRREEDDKGKGAKFDVKW